MPEIKHVRLAVTQTTVREDPRNSDELRESGRELRRLMQQAQRAGARIVHFTEGATCFPSKFVMSVDGPDKVGPADWSRFEWGVLQQELIATAELARELKLWTVLGSVHRLTPPNRPHNSVYVISDRGNVTTRYDERTLSNTKISYMYSPGSTPVIFEVDGLRFGCALGMDLHFTEIFSEYERLDVDCVLISTTGGVPHNTAVATEAQGHAATNSYWASFSVPAQHSTTAPAGVISPGGEWVAQCPQDGTPSMVVVDLDRSSENDLSTLSRSWRRKTRAELDQRDLVQQDSRSDNRSGF
jgi:predicted amidohydrolase